jgi:glycosyltransferase involved in cell wall biosynthesis
MKLSIVIPIYNEKDTLEEIFRLVQATPYEKEIIAVDDASRWLIRILVAGRPL